MRKHTGVHVGAALAAARKRKSTTDVGYIHTRRAEQAPPLQIMPERRRKMAGYFIFLSLTSPQDGEGSPGWRQEPLTTGPFTGLPTGKGKAEHDRPRLYVHRRNVGGKHRAAGRNIRHPPKRPCMPPRAVLYWNRQRPGGDRNETDRKERHTPAAVPRDDRGAAACSGS